MTASAIKRVGIVAKASLRGAADQLSGIAAWLKARGIEPMFDDRSAALLNAAVETSPSRDRLPELVDLILVLGGDGTLLAMADRMAVSRCDIPILGVNFGGLGFLTEVTLPELYKALESTLAGTAPTEERLMIRAAIMRGGEINSDRQALNDVVITRGAMSRIIDLSVSIGGEFVARFKADGLIVATPTGSTAYNLASGGPILHPAVDAFVLTPIAPHTLTNRPLVISAASELRIQPLMEADEETILTYDGQTAVALQQHDTVVITRAPFRLRLVHAATRSYYEVLRQKLKWAER
ncbi:MAG: NAD(+)/NADH kinase [Acidobacteria bacterium]|nr:NAD(+)/NADH kinase [Acidobacteriota bacterium]